MSRPSYPAPITRPSREIAIERISAGRPLRPLRTTRVRLVDGDQASRVGAQDEGNVSSPGSARGSPRGEISLKKSGLLASTPLMRYWQLGEERVFVQRCGDSFQPATTFARSSDTTGSRYCRSNLLLPPLRSRRSTDSRTAGRNMPLPSSRTVMPTWARCR